MTSDESIACHEPVYLTEGRRLMTPVAPPSRQGVPPCGVGGHSAVGATHDRANGEFDIIAAAPRSISPADRIVGRDDSGAGSEDIAG
jgi:hypothetical protein